MDAAQKELPLAPANAMPDLAAEGAVWLIAFLAAHPDGPGPGGAWPGRKICEQVGRPFDEKSRRQLRAFREAAGAVIVSGPRGYQHVSHCSIDDRQHAAEIRLGQGRKMASEALRELRALQVLRKLSATPPPVGRDAVAEPPRDGREPVATTRQN